MVVEDDPSCEHHLTWCDPPETILIVKKINDKEITKKFVELCIYLIKVSKSSGPVLCDVICDLDCVCCVLTPVKVHTGCTMCVSVCGCGCKCASVCVGARVCGRVHVTVYLSFSHNWMFLH